MSTTTHQGAVGAETMTAGQSLDLRDLHAANIARQAEWCPDQVPDLSFRGNELGGECGEAQNVIKKLERERQGWRGSRATKDDLADELADVVICADLCAVTADIDLGAAVRRKFNATSEKQGLSVFLPAPAPRTDGGMTAGEEPKGAWMQTFCLPHFRVLDPDPSQILIEDIAHHLSQNVRYGGAGIRFLSVAEHSVHMARAARPEHALWALLHDASETYLHDLVRPVKRSLTGYAEAEDRIMRAVCERFGLPPEMPAEVKRLDSRILIDETRQNMRPSDVVWSFGGETEPLGVTLRYWTPEQAEREFLATFAAITGQTVAMPATPAQPAGAVPDGLRALSEAIQITDECLPGIYQYPVHGEWLIGWLFTEPNRKKGAQHVADLARLGLAVRDIVRSSPSGPEPLPEGGTAAMRNSAAVANAISTHSPEQSAGSRAETVWTHPHLPNVAKAVVAEAEAINAALTTHPAGQSAGSGAETKPIAWLLEKPDGETHLTECRPRDDWKDGTVTPLYAAAPAKSDFTASHAEGMEPAPISTRTGDKGTEEKARRIVHRLIDRHFERTSANSDAATEAAIRDLAALAARPAAPEAEGAWLPISTAPRNDMLVMLGWWCDVGGEPRWIAVAGWYEAGPADRCWYAAYDEERVEPTHWQPLDRLPAPPASSGQEG